MTVDGLFIRANHIVQETPHIFFRAATLPCYKASRDLAAAWRQMHASWNRSRTSDLDIGLTATALVGGGHAENAVSIDVKFDLDLRDAAGRGGDAVQPEVTKRLVVLHKLALSCASMQMQRTQGANKVSSVCCS